MMCAFRSLVAEKGNVRYIKSDNGSNFVGLNNEHRKCVDEIEPELRSYLLRQGCDLIWDFNTPKASHQVGVWERPIGTLRRILDSVLRTHPGQLNDESFKCLISEVEAIANCRPLTVDTISDPDSPIPLSPMSIMTQKSKVILPPYGNFEDRVELYSKRHWRRVQHMITVIWERFKNEFFAQKNERLKWKNVRRNYEIGDIVIVMDESLHRNDWPLGIVIETFPDPSGLVRNVVVRLGRKDLNSEPKLLKRPVAKLVPTLEHDNNLD
jgi:hypothetical protein